MRNMTIFQRGFGVLAAVFLLVVLAAVGAAMTNLSMIQQSSLSLDVQGARAYQAARAGIEWGLYNSLISTPTANCSVPVASFSPPAPTLQSFTVTVQCTVSSTTPVMRQIIAVACNEPDGAGKCPGGASRSADYVERQLQATIQ